MKQMIEQNGGELGSEKHLKSLPISLTPAESIGRSQISPFSDIDICTNKNPLLSIHTDMCRSITYSFNQIFGTFIICLQN